MGWSGLARSRRWGSREPPRRLGPLGRRLVATRGQRPGPRGAVRRARAGAEGRRAHGAGGHRARGAGAAAAGCCNAQRDEVGSGQSRPSGATQLPAQRFCQGAGLRPGDYGHRSHRCPQPPTKVSVALRAAPFWGGAGRSEAGGLGFQGADAPPPEVQPCDPPTSAAHRPQRHARHRTAPGETWGPLAFGARRRRGANVTRPSRAAAHPRYTALQPHEGGPGGRCCLGLRQPPPTRPPRPATIPHPHRHGGGATRHARGRRAQVRPQPRHGGAHGGCGCVRHPRGRVGGGDGGEARADRRPGLDGAAAHGSSPAPRRHPRV